MNEVTINKNEEMVIKLIHYFITEQGYSPIILQGAKEEVWLENLNGDYKIIRIVSSYIHNDEQFNFDIFRTKQIMKSIKKKTFSLNINAISIFVNLGENVTPDYINNTDNIKCAEIRKDSDIKKYNFLLEAFPTINKKLKFKEKGMELFAKITKEINDVSEKSIKKNEDVFKPKLPIITYAIIIINTIIFLATYLFGNGSTNAYTLVKFGANHRMLIQAGELYRLVTSAFLHIGLMHLLFNNYALYVVGPQIESYLGKVKFIIIYLFSAISGSLLSVLFNNGISAGASGAIFGLLGSLLYFGYHYRVYLGSVIKSQIIPLILINLLIGFSSTGIDNAAHIGGLVGGVFVTMAVGVKYKSTKSEIINGIIMSAIFICFLLYMVFIAL